MTLDRFREQALRRSLKEKAYTKGLVPLDLWAEINNLNVFAAKQLATRRGVAIARFDGVLFVESTELDNAILQDRDQQKNQQSRKNEIAKAMRKEAAWFVEFYFANQYITGANTPNPLLFGGVPTRTKPSCNSKPQKPLNITSKLAGTSGEGTK